MQTTTDAVRYRWADLPQDHPIALIGRRRISGERVMVTEVVMETGCTVPTHAHENEQIAVVLSGVVRFGIGEEGTPERRDVDIRGGEVLHLPSNVPHSATALETAVVLDIFSPPAERTGMDRS